YINHATNNSFPTRRSSDLDTNKIIAAFFSPNESITTKDLSDEGIYVIKSDTGQLQTIMQNFTFYAIKKGKRIFDDYTYWLSLDRSEEHTSELQSRFDLVCR